MLFSPFLSGLTDASNLATMMRQQTNNTGYILVLITMGGYTGRPFLFRLQPNEASSMNRPWYKEPYVWMLIGIPLSSVIFGAFFITKAMTTKDTLVRDNYYKDGLAINQEMKWDQEAKNLGLHFEVSVNGNTATAKQLMSRLDAPTIIQLKFSHPTLKDKDLDVLLQRGEDNKTFTGFIDDFAPSRYYLQLESPEQSWRIRQEVFLESGRTLNLKP